MWLLRFIVANKITVLIPVLFVVLSLFEVAVACTEAGNRVDEVFEKSIPVSVDSGIHYIGAKITIGSPAGLFAFSLVCVSVSLLVAWHHHRITHKLKGYQRFLGSVRSLMEEAVNLSLSSADKRNTMTFIEQRGLQTLVVWSRKKDTHKFAAALLVTKDDGEYYQLERQWPPDTYTFPEGGIAGPCAAKRSIELKRLIYIPRTRFHHGVQLEWENTTNEACTSFDLAEDAFVPWLDVCTKFRPKSSICFRIPTSTDPATHYVLCLDSNKGNPFKLVDFEAVHVIGNVIARVITDLYRREKHT